MRESQEKYVFDEAKVSDPDARANAYGLVDCFKVMVEVVSPTGTSFTSSYMVLDKQILCSSEPIRMLLEMMTRDMSIIATSAVADAENNR